MTELTPWKTLADSILKALLYYDIFEYPLTSKEVFQYLPTNHVTEDDVLSGLQQLADQSIIYRLGNFYSVQNKLELAKRRNDGNLFASKSLPLARKQSLRIAAFPFVRGVFISGSLSKGFMDKKSDLDFFIITEPGRLWIARTILVLYKRIFLNNSHRHFCVNYFIDTVHLTIEEQNLFTATELATLIPMYNEELYSALMKKNGWINSFFPNYQPRKITGIFSAIPFRFKRLIEHIMDYTFGSFLEHLCKRLTINRWKRKYRKDYSSTDFEIAFKSKTYVSKNHSNNYQRKIMDLYQEKLKAFSAIHKINWNL
jgi:Nucleotidyltransferase domain